MEYILTIGMMLGLRVAVGRQASPLAKPELTVEDFYQVGWSRWPGGDGGREGGGADGGDCSGSDVGGGVGFGLSSGGGWGAGGGGSWWWGWWWWG